MTSLSPRPWIMLPQDYTDPRFVRELRAGDILLYSRDTPFNLIIKVKTWSRFTHVEVVATVEGTTRALAARNGEGVDIYTLDLKGLALVLRPVETCPPFDQALAISWFMTKARGQKYDWIGLLNFTYARYVNQDNGAMFCSEFATRYLRYGGVDLFPENDADTISPRDFSANPWLKPVWRSSKEWARYMENPDYNSVSK